MAGTILLTGASGYVGRRLLRVLEEGGGAVRCLAREPSRVAPSRVTTAVVAGDCLDDASLVAAMEGVDQAYYLVHSMASGPNFADLDRRAWRRARRSTSGRCRSTTRSDARSMNTQARTTWSTRAR